MESSPRWTLLARILRPQGRKGELLADLFTDFQDRFRQHPQVWLAPRGFSDGESTDSTAQLDSMDISAYWLPVGRNVGRVVLHFAGISTIEQAEKLVGKEIVIPASERLPLSDGSVYISDLIGCVVLDRGASIGSITDVQFPTTPDGLRRLEDAAPLLVVASPDSGELLIPFVKAYIEEVDLAGRMLRMHLPEGLTDLNRN